jgi:hypothetical protein
MRLRDGAELVLHPGFVATDGGGADGLHGVGLNRVGDVLPLAADVSQDAGDLPGGRSLRTWLVFRIRAGGRADAVNEYDGAQGFPLI